MNRSQSNSQARLFPKMAASALLPVLVLGCSQSAVRSKNAANAPALSGEAQAHIRGVSDPNAQFTLIDRTKSSTKASPSGNSAAPLCESSSLEMYEAAASMNGDSRLVRLAFKNRGASACRLSGFPRIQLQDKRGEAIASIAVRQTSSLSVSATVAPPVQDASVSPEVDIVLRPATEASFEIGWSTGADCPLVSHFTVELPASPGSESTFSGAFSISRPINVCNGEVRVTALSAGDSV